MKLTEPLSIRYPIIQAPMNWATNPSLVAAVSEAGGLGSLGPNAGNETPTSNEKETAVRLRNQIRMIRKLTDKPFPVNFPIGHGKGKNIVMTQVWRKFFPVVDMPGLKTIDKMALGTTPGFSFF